MRLPDFLIIGAAKAGTTTLYEYLIRHPQIYMSTPKEPEFFAREENYAKGIDWYASLFSDAAPHQVCGEASTRYTMHPWFPAADRIVQVLPRAKLIYLMRHPVERTYSHYVQSIKNSQNTRLQLEVTETFEERIQRDDFMLDTSNYIKQIEHYLQFYSQDSFLFLLMEDLIENPANILRKVCNFIGVDDTIDLLAAAPIAANQASSHYQRFLREQTTAKLRSNPVIDRTAKLLPQWLRDRAYQLLTKLPYRKSIEKKYLPPPMLPETRQMLLERFREPNHKLSKLLDRDLSHWSK
jgi:hypothetical protein